MADGAAGAADASGATEAAPGTILQGGRAKAYRPLPEAERLAAYERGLAAYERGEFALPDDTDVGNPELP